MKEVIKKLQSYVPEEPIENIKRRYELKRIVRLSANENPYGSSPKVIEMLKQFDFSQENYYPDSYAKELRAEVAKKLEIDEGQLVFGVGLDEIIAYLSRVFLQAGDEVIIPQPTFSEYALNAEIEGAKVVNVSIDNETSATDFATILSAINEKTRMIWICNPNNPTGVYEPTENLRQFINQVPENVLVLIDEAYIHFVTETNNPSAISLVNEFNNVGVMRTFSKAYGLANYRVGFIVLPLTLAGYLQKIRLPYNLNTISQKVAITALEDQKFLSEVVKKNGTERQKWLEFLKGTGLKYYNSQANFVYFYIDNPEKLANKLLENGYQVRQGLEQNSLRITVGKTEDNEQIQKIIYQYLEDIKVTD